MLREKIMKTRTKRKGSAKTQKITDYFKEIREATWIYLSQCVCLIWMEP